jgi:hypothetical protein
MANGVVEACWLHQLLVELHNPYRGPLWSTATTSAPSTSPPTPFSTSTPNMLRLIFTLSMSALSPGTSVSYTSRPLLSSSTSSPRGCPPRCSRSFGPVSTSVVATVSTARGVLGPLGLCVYRVVGTYVGRSPTPRLYDCNHSLEIN